MRYIIGIILLLVCFTLAFSMPALAHGDMKNQIQRKVAYGKVAPLIHIFKQGHVTLSLFGSPSRYTKKEAKPVLKEFFEEHPPQSCQIKKQGSYKNDTRWFKGTYRTKQGETYPAYFEATLNPDKGHYHLSLIRIHQ